MTAQNWPIRLFSRSVLKQRKYAEITALLGPTADRCCLDIGADNGVISYLLRQRGGSWKSADLDEQAVRSIRELVETDVYQIDGTATPFSDDTFDVVVIIDFLEHIADDHGFVRELWRITKPSGALIINVPHIKNSWLRRFRHAIGQTDEKHGHLRPGYTIQSIEVLLGDCFSIESHHTYSKFFSEFVDTMMIYGISRLKGDKGDQSQKGNVVTGQDMKSYQRMFQLYSLIYPFVWFIAKLDYFVFFRSGYMLMIKARTNK